MKRKISAAIILLLVFFSGVAAAAGVNGKYAGYDIIKIFSANKELQAEDVPAINFKGRTLVPIGVLKQLGVEVEWNAKQQRVDVSLPVRTVAVLTAEQLDSLSKYVYEVTTAPTDGFPNGKTGSGFIIDNYMVTNEHVAGDAAFAQAHIDGNVQKVTKYDFVNEKVDIMGFAVQGGKSLPYATELPKIGDPVYLLGFPAGELSVSEGEVEFIYPVDGVDKIAYSAKTAAGFSGAVLLNGRGEVIGMHEGYTVEEGQRRAWAIPTKYLIAEIQNLK